MVLGGNFPRDGGTSDQGREAHPEPRVPPDAAHRHPDTVQGQVSSAPRLLGHETDGRMRRAGALGATALRAIPETAANLVGIPPLVVHQVLDFRCRAVHIGVLEGSRRHRGLSKGLGSLTQPQLGPVT